jgi:hypothetical protein
MYIVDAHARRTLLRDPRRRILIVGDGFRRLEACFVFGGIIEMSIVPFNLQRPTTFPPRSSTLRIARKADLMVVSIAAVSAVNSKGMSDGHLVSDAIIWTDDLVFFLFFSRALRTLTDSNEIIALDEAGLII